MSNEDNFCQKAGKLASTNFCRSFHLEEMKSRPIELCLDKMECRRNPLNKLDKKYTMVEYIDSTECTPCALNKLRIWNPLIMEARAKGVE